MHRRKGLSQHGGGFRQPFSHVLRWASCFWVGRKLRAATFLGALARVEAVETFKKA